MSNDDGNLQKYESADIVAHYASQDALQPAEQYLFGKYIPEGVAVLDMGVGGGRTTPHLSARASRYVGADYSQAMVQACQRRFPALEFRHCDATDMSQFGDGEFDVVVFSFNGIDVIRTDEGRARCLAEAARVLKPNGAFIFSSHNARVLAVPPQLRGAKPHQVVWRIVRSISKSVKLAIRAVRVRSYRAGEGYIRDPVHGGMDHYVSTPQTMTPQLAAAGLRVLEVVAGPDPSIRSQAFTSWHYYACRKDG